MKRLTAFPLMCALVVAALILRLLTRILTLAWATACVLAELALGQLVDRRVDVMLAMLGLTKWSRGD